MFVNLGGILRNRKTYSIFSFAIAIVLSGIIASSFNTLAATAPPNTISYQGRLLDTNGVPLVIGSVNMQFRFYDSLAAGTCLYSNDDAACATDADIAIDLTEGLFTAIIGDTGAGFAAIDPTIFGDNAGVYLEVEVAGEVLTPRRPFTAAPYALNAHTLDGLTTADLAADLDSVYATDSDKVLAVGASNLYFDLDAGDFNIRDSLNTPLFDFSSAGGFIAHIQPSEDFSIESDGESTNTTLLFVNGSSSSDNFANMHSSFIAVDDTSADTMSNLYLYTQPNDVLDTVYGLRVAGISNTSNLALSALGLFEHLEPSATLFDGLLVNGTGVITDALDVSDTDIVNGVNFGTNRALFDTLNFSETTSGTLALSNGTDDFFSLTDVGLGRLTSKIGFSSVLPADSATLDVGVPNITLNANIPMIRSLPFTQTFTAFGANYSGADALYTNQFLAPTFDFGFTGPSGESATVYIDGAPDIGLSFVTTKALYVESGAVDFNGNLDVGSGAGSVATIRGNLYVDDEASSTIVRIGNNGSAFTPMFQALEAKGNEFAGIFLNDGNLDNRHVLQLQGCLDTNPTSACKLTSYRDGDGTNIGAVEGNGAGGVTFASPGSDYAELFPGNHGLFGSGNILSLNSLTGEISLAGAGEVPFGAYSVSPNTLGNWQEDWQDLGTVVPVGLLGQLPVDVSGENGSIQAGDAIAISSVPGVGARAVNTGMILGYALESWSGVGQGTIQVYVRPGFFAGSIQDDGTMLTFGRGIGLASTGVATDVAPGYDSELLSFRGSGWNTVGVAAESVGFSVKAAVNSADDYKLSYRNAADVEVAYLTQSGLMQVSGDVVVGGNLYPSDRGVSQTDKYIYYDGSAGPGGDFIRTNAAGWSTGSYDFAEMFPAEGTLEAGQVVAFSSSKETVKKAGSADVNKLAGIVSTRPGFLAGENVKGHVPIALAGRVPTLVTNENGNIEIGDPLTVSATRAGFAMKATSPGPVVGYALEPMSATDGTIIVYVNVSYFDGGTTGLPGTTTLVSGSSPSKSGVQNLKTLNMEGDIFMQGNSITNIGRLVGISNAWSIEADGTIKTTGRFVASLTSFQNEVVEVPVSLSIEDTITLSGSGTISGGMAVINFEDISPTFNDVTSTTAPIRVVVTPNMPSSLYVTEKSHNGFTVNEVQSSGGDITFDWVVFAYRSGFEPEEKDPTVTEETPATETPVEEVIPVEETPLEEVLSEVVPVVETPAEEIAPVEEVLPVEETPVEPPVSEVVPVVEEVL